jgi:3-oxoacyl-[acyl-carrier protein] reductase
MESSDHRVVVTGAAGTMGRAVVEAFVAEGIRVAAVDRHPRQQCRYPLEQKALDTTPEEWNRVMAINLNGAFYLTREALPAMRQAKWGRIINTSSYAAKSGGLTAGTAYSVSKAAIVGLTFSIAAETTRDGITVNGIAPAYVRTPMVTEQLTAEQRAEVEAKIPVGRFCEPDEFAHAVLFLASEKSGFITGEIVDMNGGFHFD